MAIQDSFADAVTRAQQELPPLFQQPPATAIPPQQPAGPQIGFGQPPVSGPGSPAEALGGAITAAPAPTVHINVGAPSAGDPYAGQTGGPPPAPPTDPLNPLANQLGMVDPAANNDARLGQMNDQEMKRREFAASLSPEVSQAFAAFMNGIAEQESLKKMAATPQSMFGG